MEKLYVKGAEQMEAEGTIEGHKKWIEEVGNKFRAEHPNFSNRSSLETLGGAIALEPIFSKELGAIVADLMDEKKFGKADI